MHHFGTEMYISVPKWWIVGYGTGALWNLRLVYCCAACMKMASVILVRGVNTIAGIAMANDATTSLVTTFFCAGSGICHSSLVSTMHADALASCVSKYGIECLCGIFLPCVQGKKVNIDNGLNGVRFDKVVMNIWKNSLLLFKGLALSSTEFIKIVCNYVPVENLFATLVTCSLEYADVKCTWLQV